MGNSCAGQNIHVKDLCSETILFVNRFCKQPLPHDQAGIQTMTTEDIEIIAHLKELEDIL